jgi:IPT/TIG domain
VHVSAENFIDTTTMCRFGTALVDAAFISQALLSCISPVLKIGLAPVSITMNGVDFVSNETLEYDCTTIVLHTTALREDRIVVVVCHFGKQKVRALY